MDEARYPLFNSAGSGLWIDPNAPKSNLFFSGAASGVHALWIPLVAPLKNNPFRGVPLL